MGLLFCLVTSIYVLILLSFLIGLFLPNKKHASKRYQVSVVVAARNEQHNIENLLHDLVQQTYPSALYEIIIVNDGSEDRTGEVIDNFVHQFDFVKQIYSQPDPVSGLFAKKNALNQGIRQGSGELILTIDADCRVKSTWIETMVSYFADDVGMVVGFSQLGKRGNQYTLLERLQAIDFLTLMAAAQGSVNLNFPLAASGQNFAYRKQAFEQVGGYERIKNRVSGDDVLLLQLVKKLTSWKIRFAPSEKAFNWTQPEKTLKSFLNQRKRWASNGSYQFYLNKGFFFFILTVFLMNILVLVGSPLYFFKYNSLKLPLVCFGAKILIEFLVCLKGSQVYHRQDLVKYFPIWAILQVPYVIFTGLMGSLGHFIWKDRKYFQDLTIFRTGS
jgi:cellulose synthase/poly-beta-1,6-N-acetylglucosamine synthase-like glycosyltransferase